jgi:hypothetical protein
VIGLYRACNSFLPYPRDFILKRLPPQPLCCEIGVWRGDFSKRIHSIAKPKKLFLIDPWLFFDDISYAKDKLTKYTQEAQDTRYASVLKIFQNQIDNGSVSILRMTSKEALPQFDDNFFDFVYIDGNHEYEFVKFEIENYYTKTKPGGILSGDDYRLLGVQTAVNEFIAKNNLHKYLEIKNDQFVITKPTVTQT